MSLWIKNANIATMDENNPVAASAVVIGDFFAYVGDEQGAAAFLAQHPQKELQELDCKGQFLLPGFNDSHMHYMHYCKAKMGANLGPSSSMALEFMAPTWKQVRITRMGYSVVTASRSRLLGNRFSSVKLS